MGIVLAWRQQSGGRPQGSVPSPAGQHQERARLPNGQGRRRREVSLRPYTLLLSIRSVARKTWFIRPYKEGTSFAIPRACWFFAFSVRR